MATTNEGLPYPAGGDDFDPAGDIQALAQAMAGRIVVPVANTTDRAAVASAFAPTASKPLYVHRADAPVGRALEYTRDGSAWYAVTGDSLTWTAIPAASGYTSAGFSRLEEGGTVVRLAGTITINTGNLVRATTVGTVTTAHRPANNRRIATAIGNSIAGSATSALSIANTGAIQLTADSTALGAHTIVYLDGITYTVADPA